MVTPFVASFGDGPCFISSWVSRGVQLVQSSRGSNGIDGWNTTDDQIDSPQIFPA